MLKWNNICFSYREKKIFSGVNISFSQPANYCLLGTNGSGKSTFLKLSANMLEPLSGNIESSFNHFSFVPPHLQLHPCLKVSDLIDMYLSKPQDFKKTKEFSIFNIDTISEETYLSQLSSGQQQRLVLALSLVKKAKVRFFDEPLNHLDLYYQNAFYKALELSDSLNFMVFHDLQACLQIKNAKILLVSKDKILDLGLSEEALTKKELQKTFHIQTQITDNPIDGNKQLAYSNYEPK